MKKISILNEENYNKFGTLMKVIEDNNATDIIVEFQDEYKHKTHTTRNNFKKGKVKNLYDKSVFSVGYIGEGKYKCRQNGNNTLAYTKWFDMLRRCYDPYYINKHSTYINCYVCKEWLCFQTFAEWYEENYYDYLKDNPLFGGKLQLDKDLLNKGNKVYSPNNCLLVPQIINKAFIKSDAKRGHYPIGVSKIYGNKFKAYCNNILLKKVVHLGTYDTSEKAFEIYKNYKEDYLKRVADLFKEELGENFYKRTMFQDIYNSLYNYKVEEND